VDVHAGCGEPTEVERCSASQDGEVAQQARTVEASRLALRVAQALPRPVGHDPLEEDLGLVGGVVGERHPSVRTHEDPRQRRFVDRHEPRQLRFGEVGAEGDDPSVAVPEVDDRSPLRLAARDGYQVLDVVRQREGLQTPGTLVPAPVVGHDVEGFAASSQPREGAAAVETPVHADDGGLGSGNPPFGDRQACDGRAAHVMQVQGGDGRRGHK
jgi:hypothetical protein